MAIPPPPLTDAEVSKTLFDMEQTLRYRLRMSEIVPVEMSQYHIGKDNLYSMKLCSHSKDRFVQQLTAVLTSLFQNCSTHQFAFEEVRRMMDGSLFQSSS
jgi:hypothetical protein